MFRYFLFGCIVEIVTVGNYNPGNAGLIFYLDIATPLTLITLLAYSRFVAGSQTG